MIGKRADFQVYVENQRVKAGSTLCGAVFLDVSKPISGNSVVVNFVGTEETVVMADSKDMSKRSNVPKKLRPVVKGAQAAAECTTALIGGSSAAKASRLATDDKQTEKEENRTIMSVELPVGTQDMIDSRRISPGQYKLPFEINLPPLLPASFGIEQQEGSCTVKYFLEAQLKGSGIFKDYKDCIQVYVDAKPVDEGQISVPFEGPPKEFTVRMLGRFGNGGAMTYACHASNTVVGCGQEIKVKFACINNSTMGVRDVVATLKQYVEWKAKGFSHEHCDRIVSKSFGTWDDLKPVSAKEVKQRREAASKPKGTTVSTDDRTTATDVEEDTRILTALLDERHSLSIQIPTNVIPTYEGPLIRVRHVLQVKVVSQVLFNFIAPCRKIEIPIQIFDATDKHLGLPPIVPPNWVEDGALIVAQAVLAGTGQMNYHVSSPQASGKEGGGNNNLVPDRRHSPSLEVLLQELRQSSNAESVMSQKVQDPDWQRVFQQMSPSGCAALLQAVDLDFRKLVVAIVLADKCGRRFTCQHARECILVVSQLDASLHGPTFATILYRSRYQSQCHFGRTKRLGKDDNLV